MPHNPISVGMKVYALQLKQKSTAAGFDGILRKFKVFNHGFIQIRFSIFEILFLVYD